MIINMYKEILLKDYNNIFLNNKRINENALKTALDIRKFEIELYWKRATYFWAFIAVIFAGYFSVSQGSANHDVILMVICCLGLVFSLSWYMVNKGSKFWQNNWEYHVDLLENKINGPLYKTIIYNSDISTNRPSKPYPFSVSKINQMLSFFLVMVWLILAVITLVKTFLNINIAWRESYKFIDLVFNILIVVGTVCFATIMFKKSRSKFREYVKDDEKDKIKIIQRENIL